MSEANSKARTALVIGATGGIGGAVARALLARGWRVRATSRAGRPAAGSALAGAQWIKADAMNPDEVVAAAEGADLIVHAANPPGYQDWDRLVPGMLESAVAAAKASGARLVMPGTVYNYGPDARGLVDEAAPQNPETRKGRIRAAAERRLKESGVKVLIVRAGDFFGPGATGNSWFGQMVRPGRPVRAVTYPGDRRVGHAWAYLPDLGETVARLVEREAELDPFAVFHFGGHWLEPGVGMAEAIRRAAGRPEAPIRAFPWLAVVALSPFVPLFREILEMRYLWRRPLRLDDAKLRAFLGEEPHTPLDLAVATALDALGCREGAAQASGGAVAAPA